MTNLFSLKHSPKMLAVFILVIGILVAGSVFAQSYGTVKGTVTEEATGNSLTGTNVYLKDTRLGAVTDINGEFEIVRVPPGSYVIQVSFIGYRTDERTFTVGANQTVTLDFALAVDVLGLGEVVVTGMGGTQIKEKLGVTITKVDGEKLAQADVPNIVGAMSGKVANVEITSASGDPGGSTYIRIRGATTVTGGTQPLFVVDGIPIDNSSRTTEGTTGGTVAINRAADLNVDDIESMEVLKGAAAAAIYGSRAANGVILITTKSGKPGKTRISFKSVMSIDQVTANQRLQRKYGQGDGITTPAHQSWGAEITGTTYDHAGELFEDSYTFENGITVSGGNEFTTFFMSANNYDQDGIMVGNGAYDRKTIRLKGKQVVTEKVTLEANIFYAKSNSDLIQRGSNVAGLLLTGYRTPPNYNNLPYLNEDGLHHSYRVPNPTVVKQTRGFDNPFWVLNEHINTSVVARTIANVKLDYEPYDWLNLSYTLGSDFSFDDRLTVLPPGTSGVPDGYIRHTDMTNQQVDNNVIATVELGQWIEKFNDNISGTFMGGYNQNSRMYKRYQVDGQDMGHPTFYQLDNLVEWTPNEFEQLQHTQSYFGQMTLDLYDQLFLTGAVRNDGSSTFSQNKRRFWYPKFSAAWEFTRFSGMPELPYLNYGKARFAYGVAGRQPNPYTMITGFASGNFGEGWGPTLPIAYLGVAGFATSGTKAQENIEPERVTEYEGGLDLAFMDSRIGVEITYYFAKTTDAIFTLPLPPSTGYTRQTLNAAQIENKGWELVFDANVINRKDFSWDLGFVWAANDNIVTSLPGAEYLSLGGFTSCQGVAWEGEPMGSHRGGDFVRFGNSAIVDGVNIDTAYPTAPADALYIDATGYPIKSGRVGLIGDPNPDWTGSIRSEFRLFNKVSISGLLDIKQGGQIWNGTRGALTTYGTSIGTINRGEMHTFQGYGPGAGTSVVLDRTWYAGIGGGFGGCTRQFIDDGSYMKLREIAVSYNLQHEFLNRLGLSSMDVRLSGRNLKTWTDYDGVDPETNLTGNTNLRGMDYFQNPQSRSFILTLRLNY